MHRFSVVVAGLIAAAVLVTPFAASAFGFSFGGRVVSVVPCISVAGPSLHVTIIPAGLAQSVLYIWTPLTLTFSYGPPHNPGQQVLGLADIPFACYIPATPPIFLYGLRMQMVGTSLF